jgi:hypothetical protein
MKNSKERLKKEKRRDAVRETQRKLKKDAPRLVKTSDG